jgi:type IV pilus assembly protein PilF
MRAAALAAVLLLAGLLAGCASQGERNAETKKRAQRVDVHTRLGATYLHRNQLDVALQELERALELDPDDSQANNMMGLLQIRLRNDDKAERHFRRAVSEDSDNSEARNNYGVFLCERNRLDEADKQFGAALANPLYRTPEQAALNAGLCALRKPDKAAATRYLRTALEKDPRLAPALYQMARLSYESGQALSARGFMQRYFEVGPDTPEVLLLAFRIERALGAKDAQASYAVRLRGKFPDSAEAKQLRTLTGR